jgi:hypothetical protein
VTGPRRVVRYGCYLELVRAPAGAWSAERVGIAPPATRRAPARRPPGRVDDSRARRADAPVVVPPPALDDDLGLAERVEDLAAVQQLIPEARIEALDVTVLPGAPGLDVGRARADSPFGRPDLIGRRRIDVCNGPGGSDRSRLATGEPPIEVVRDLGDPDQADRLGHRRALRGQDVDLAAAWRRSPRACVASSPSWSSSGLKPYLRSDHLSGGGSAVLGAVRSCRS